MVVIHPSIINTFDLTVKDFTFVGSLEQDLQDFNWIEIFCSATADLHLVRGRSTLLSSCSFQLDHTSSKSYGCAFLSVVATLLGEEPRISRLSSCSIRLDNISSKTDGCTLSPDCSYFEKDFRLVDSCKKKKGFHIRLVGDESQEVRGHERQFLEGANVGLHDCEGSDRPNRE